MEQLLEGKIAIVTGSAAGIGRAIACRFAQHGARLLLVDQQRAAGQALAAQLQRDGRDAAFIAADLSDGTQARQIIEEARARFGRLDVLVNNAALYGPVNKLPLASTTEEVWDRTLQVNLRSPFILCRYGIPLMLNRGGAIINIASIGGLAAFPDFAAYSVSKAALIQMTRSIALDYASQGVRANAICPGAIDTPGNDQFVEDREAYLATIRQVTPMGSPGIPDDVADAALYLASSRSRYVTGSTLVVDGGRSARA